MDQQHLLESLDYTIEHKALYEVIADKMEFAILSDTTQISQKLPSEQFLADSFGVSRPVIREALKILKERGLITSRQGASSIITDYDIDSFTKSINRIACMKNVSPEQIFQVRTVLEIKAVKMAAENPNKEQVEELRRLNRAMGRYTKEDFPEKIRERAQLDVMFHSTISNMSGNLLLQYMTEALSSILIPVIEKTVDEQTALDGIHCHEKLITAILSGDSKSACDLMRSHLMLSMRNYEVMNDK